MKSLRTSSILLLAALAVAGCPEHTPTKPTQPKTGTGLSPWIPRNIETGQLNQQGIDALGWQMFTAFNWPALAGTRGEPDPNKTIGSPGTVVWETWKTPDEVFYPDGSQPPDWNSNGTKYPAECNYSPANPGLLVDRTAQASGGSLTDANGNIVYYFISFNKPVFDFVYNNGYYSITGQGGMTGTVDYPVGTVEMKAAWRVVLPAEPDEVKKRFFRRNLYVYTPGNLNASGQASCEYKEMALIGLHFNLKVAYPDNSTQWLMATFEQVDNVPPFNTPYQPGTDPSHTLPYSLFDKTCYGASPPCKYNWSTEAVPNPRPWQKPANAIRTMNIDPQAQSLNPQWQQLLRTAVADSPWQYYEMVTTQYPSDPTQQPTGNPTPPTSANTTMETFVRPSSCLGCHHDANNATNKWFADYSFMLAQACPPPLFGNFTPTAACPRHK